MDDRRIIDLFFARNEDAINLTKEKYGRYLNSIAFDILGDRHDAAECESDTYLRAWNSIPPTDPRSLPAYLAKIVRNIALNRIRTDTRRIPLKMSLILDELSEVIPDVEGDIAERLGIRECIVGYVNGLERERRNIFLKRYFYLMSVNDIASDMGMRVGTVKSILFRMREELRSYLNERGIEI
jgi:RNA polymerase sigma-70 factor (ECF subfamily)